MGIKDWHREAVIAILKTMYPKARDGHFDHVINVYAQLIADAEPLGSEDEELREQWKELVGGDGIYYITQERAFAPGIADGWPDVIPAPHTKNGRLVKRVVTLKQKPQ